MNAVSTITYAYGADPVKELYGDLLVLLKVQQENLRKEQAKVFELENSIAEIKQHLNRLEKAL